jgi:hypothetical protein
MVARMPSAPDSTRTRERLGTKSKLDHPQA